MSSAGMINWEGTLFGFYFPDSFFCTQNTIDIVFMCVFYIVFDQFQEFLGRKLNESHVEKSNRLFFVFAAVDRADACKCG